MNDPACVLDIGNAFCTISSVFCRDLTSSLTVLSGPRPTRAAAQAPGELPIVNTFRNIGLALSTVVCRGPILGFQRLYAGIGYNAAKGHTTPIALTVKRERSRNECRSGLRHRDLRIGVDVLNRMEELDAFGHGPLECLPTRN